MQILQKYTSNFSTLDNFILQDSTLSLDTRGLYAYMVSLPNDWHFSYERLARANNVGLRVIRKCLKELQNASLLEIERTRTNKGTNTIYKLYDSSTKPCKTIGKEQKKDIALQNDRQKETSKDTSNNANNDISTQSTQDNQPNILQPNILQPCILQPCKTIPLIKKDNIQKKNLTKKDFLKKENIKRKKDFLDFAKEIFAKENPKYLTLEKWLTWVEYKKQRIGAKLSTHTISLNLKKLIEFEDLAEQAIENSIANGWQGLFYPKRDDSSNGNKRDDSSNDNKRDDSLECLCEKMLFKKVDIFTIQKYEILKEKNVVLFYGADRYLRQKRVYEVPFERAEILKFKIFCEKY